MHKKVQNFVHIITEIITEFTSEITRNYKKNKSRNLIIRWLQNKIYKKITSDEKDFREYMGV